MIYLIHETILNIHTKTVRVCNNDTELILTLNDPEFKKTVKGKLSVEKVVI